jgi:hypothetical protein
MNRTKNEKFADVALLLYLIGLFRSKSGLYLGITKLDKLTFLSEKEMLDQKVRGFNYEFFKWHHGPLSTDIYTDLDVLRRAGFVSGNEDIALTAHGVEALRKLRPLFKDHRLVTTPIDVVTRRSAGLTTQNLTERVYETTVTYPMGSKKIKDIPKGQVILSPPARERTSATFELNDSWLETLEIILDREGYDSLKRATIEAEKGVVKPFG